MTAAKRTMKTLRWHLYELPDAPVDPPDDVDWDAPDPLAYEGQDVTLLLNIRVWAGNPAVPYQARVALYLAAARIEELAGQAK